MKTRFAVCMLAIFLAAAVPAAYAHQCQMMKGSEHGQHGQSGFEGKFCHKARFILENEEELGLTEEQVKKIGDLQLQTKKSLIGKDAEIEALALDINSKLNEDTIDTKAVSELINMKYELKKEKAKLAVESMASLKNILTDEQKKKLKGIWKKCRK